MKTKEEQELDNELTNPASELCFLSGNQKREIVKLVNKAKQEERERILIVLPKEWKNVQGDLRIRADGYNECLKQVKNILKELK